MAVAMFVRLPISPKAYERLLATLELDVNPPAGAILHVAADAGEALELCEVWQTREAAEGFLYEVLEPAVEAFGVKQPLEHLIMPLHNLYAPDIDTIERIGAVSLPGASPGSWLR